MEVCGKSFTIGADPEVFVGKNGEFVSAHGMVPGDKIHPHVVEKGAVQVDGMALEFNIDPASDAEQFEDHLSTVQEILGGMIGDHEFLNEASVSFDEKFLEGIPTKNRELGCSADYNGWLKAENPSPDASTLMRTAGGHVHIGGFETRRPFGPEHFFLCARLARILDETLGTYSVLWDTDDKRRSMYGQAGCFRPKRYGMEYRTLSNKWIFDRRLIRFVFDATKLAIEKTFSSEYEPDVQVQHIINNSDRTNVFFEGNPVAKQLMG